ncbi:MAG TPA: helix-turn-helix domain-containing protein [Methylomirabilota bacterium]|nr:helix-turn-helix domain-containing protein [Methylomirabilota bacterium]
MGPGHRDRREGHRCSAAPLLGVSVYMVRSLIRQRRLPYHRIGRRIVLDRQDLEHFLRAHRVEARELRSDPPRRPLTPSADRLRAPRPRADRRDASAPDRDEAGHA